VGRPEVIQQDPLPAQDDFHVVVEDDVGNRRKPAFTDDVLSRIDMRDRNSRIVEDLQSADVHLVIVTENHVSHRNAEAPEELRGGGVMQPALSQRPTRE